MPASAAFIRIKADVLKLVAAIPPGKLCSFLSIGEHLDVMPRHVAYILSQLTPAEKNLYPWFRVVSGEGKLGAPKFAAEGKPQAELLRDEAILVTAGAVVAWEKKFIAAGKLKSGVPKQLRSAEAVRTTAAKAKQ